MNSAASLSFCQPEQPQMQIRVQRQRNRPAPVGGHRWACLVRWQRQLRRQVREGRLPVLHVRGHGSVLARVIVHWRQRAPRRLSPVAPGGVGRRQIPDQRAQRPLIGGEADAARSGAHGRLGTT